MTYVLLHANTVKDGDVEGWMKFLPGNCDISEIREYREKLRTAKPDPNMTESYRLRGKPFKLHTQRLSDTYLKK